MAVATKSGEPYRILLYADVKDKEMSDDEFGLSMAILVGKDAWEQVDEILAQIRLGGRPLAFFVDGMLGLKTAPQIRGLAAHGTVMWKVPESAADAASKIAAEKKTAHAINVVVTKKVRA